MRRQGESQGDEDALSRHHVIWAFRRSTLQWSLCPNARIPTTSTSITTIATPDWCHQGHLLLTQLAFCLFLPLHLRDKEWLRRVPAFPALLANKAFQACFKIPEKGGIKTLPSPLFYFLFIFVSLVTQPSTHTFSHPSGFLSLWHLQEPFEGEVSKPEGFFTNSTYSTGPLEYVLTRRPYGGLNHYRNLHWLLFCPRCILLRWFLSEVCLWLEVDWAVMAGKGNQVPGPHLNGFPIPTYSYFFPHMLGSLSPPALPGLPISGYSTPSPASK